MKCGRLTFALLASFALPASLPADARDYALPAKNPAVTMTLPDDWNFDAGDDEINTVASDGYLVFNVSAGDRSELENLLKEAKAYLRKGKVNLNVKPAESSMEIGGVPARVLRYTTTAGTEKTVVDLVTVEASRDRVVLLTIWGTKDERAANEAALEAVMKSIKLPADAGSGKSGLLSGVTPPAVRIEGGTVTGGEPKPAAPPVAAAKPAAPVLVRKNIFVTEDAERFGVFTPRTSNTFRQDETIKTYLEATGATLFPAEGDKVRFGYVIDFSVKAKDGAVLGGQKAVVDQDIVVLKGDLIDGNPKFYLDYALGISAIPPGAYILGFTVRDRHSDRSATTEQPFVVVPAGVPAPAAGSTAQEGTTCAGQTFRIMLLNGLHGSAAFKDGKRRVTDLVDPETILEDKATNQRSCRYTALVSETRDGAPVEYRWKATFTLTDDNIDFKFD